MLETLDVRNYALIERLSVSFDAGLNVLSGETGAGKSILVGALGLLLGQKADADCIRTGSDEVSVACTLLVEGNPDVLAWLAARDIEPEESTIIVRRTIKRSRRGSIFIQSTPATRGDLADLGGMLFDLHGQHQHQSLLSTETHRQYLDRFGGFENLTEELGQIFHRLTTQREALQTIVSDERERLRQIDLLNHAVSEIGEADLKVAEEDELLNQRSVLANAEQLHALLEGAHERTAESRGGALAALRQVRRDVDEAAAIDRELLPLAQRLESSFYELEDLAEELRSHRDGVDVDPGGLEEVESRLVLIRSLQKKYGDSVADVIEYRNRSEQELQRLHNWEEERGDLEADVTGLEADLVRRAGELSARREAAAGELEGRIEEELRDLEMSKVRFRVQVSPRTGSSGKPVYSRFGGDAVEFLISPNEGEPFKKLKSIASGGELSRVMLAVKSVLADQDSIPTLIFDEVDAGIGGEVALGVAEKLAQLAQGKQVLCITHLATIAVRAHNHLRVVKAVREGRSVTEVEPVAARERVEEIARMLAGDQTNRVSLEHARELIATYSPRAPEDAG